ncbi:zinc finger BED domain-containing protein RICESLEEPER 2-like [Nicotiana tabacum]|uniref:Zinc finger BED domain-containing protein RICESLEEPER 2-like n=1 Tax=Nicotiana tabacum TaxID=4097 RepID=A0A1S3ZQ80_TOBAC|nr:PREDICTED: zinc finger BED domain-containing protein RICESLEEPER 2-like isoform X1 [Nicotiana tabacum]
MAAVITNCLLDWGLKNVFTITVDNASSNDVSIREVPKQLTTWGTKIMNGKHLYVRCMAHILNLIVQDGLKEIDVSIKRVRQDVRYIRLFPARIRKFKEYCESQKLTSKRTLCLDVSTRWNSTYMMLDTAQQFELAFDKYSFFDTELLHHFRTYLCENGTSAGDLTSADWDNVRTMVKFLETFYFLTLRVSGSIYVTSNVYFVQICELDLILKEWMEHEDASLKEMAKKIKEKFVKYWGEPEKMNNMIIIASILDPSNKLDYVPFAIVRMFGEKEGEKLILEVKNYINSLFDYYVKKISKGSTSASSGNTTTTVTGYGSFLKRGTMRTKLKFEKYKEVTGGLGAKSELDRYLAEDIEPETDEFKILKWWKINEPRFSILAEMARNVLVIPISSVASECAFSTGGHILDSFRSSLTPKLVQSLICLQDWLRSEPIPIKVEEDLEYLEQLKLGNYFIFCIYYITNSLLNTDA